MRRNCSPSPTLCIHVALTYVNRVEIKANGICHYGNKTSWWPSCSLDCPKSRNAADLTRRLFRIQIHKPPPEATKSFNPIMSSSYPITLDPATIDDILYFARTNSLADLTELLSTTATSLSTNSTAILRAAIDPDTGNSALHMASANGHTGIYFFP